MAGPQQAGHDGAPAVLERVLGWLGTLAGGDGDRSGIDEADWQSSFEEECRCPGPCNRDHENE